MEWLAHLVAIIKTLKTATTLVSELARKVQDGDERKKLVREWKDAASSGRNDFWLDVSYIESRFESGGEITYADLCHNIHHMIRLRTGIVMRLESLLSKSHPSEEELKEGLWDLHGGLQSLDMLMRMFHAITSVSKDERFMYLPGELHKMLSETDFMLVSWRRRTEFDKNMVAFEDLLSDQECRRELVKFCDEMKRTVAFLCEMKLSPSSAVAKRSAARRSQKRDDQS